MNTFKNPFPYSDSNKRYHTFDYYMRNNLSQKCARIPLDGGFTCPNIDGAKVVGGCIYCGMKNSPHTELSLKRQFEEGCKAAEKKWKTCCKIAYFNSFTATYAPTERLRELFEEALSFPDVKGIIIGTRADCLSNETVNYLNELNERTFLLVEIGLQTVSDKIAEKINRRHSFEDFIKGYEKLKNIRKGVHLINYLPGESYEMMLENVKTVSSLKPALIKLHSLFVTENTMLYDMYKKGDVYIPPMDEYVSLVCDEIELIPPEICLGRLSGDAPRNKTAAPEWSLRKKTILNEIDKELLRRGTYQGFLCK